MELKLNCLISMSPSLMSNQTLSPLLHYFINPITNSQLPICDWLNLSQTSFDHISIDTLTILTVSIATESPQKTF